MKSRTGRDNENKPYSELQRIQNCREPWLHTGSCIRPKNCEGVFALARFFEVQRSF